MPELEIGRLALNIPGLHPDAAPRLAKLVADGLGRAALPDVFRAERLDIELSAGAHGASVEQLAHQIIRELLRQMGA